MSDPINASVVRVLSMVAGMISSDHARAVTEYLIDNLDFGCDCQSCTDTSFRAMIGILTELALSEHDTQQMGMTLRVVPVPPSISDEMNEAILSDGVRVQMVDGRFAY